MPKIVIIGSCRYEPYEILASPKKNPMWNTDIGYIQATKIFYPAIDDADEIWVYAPDGLGIHTTLDYEYARQKGKTIRFLAQAGQLNATFFGRLFEKFDKLSISVKVKLRELLRSLATTARK